MFGWLKDLFKLFKKILKFIIDNFLIILLVVIIVLAIFFPALLVAAWAWLSTVALPTLAGWGAAVAAFFAELGILGTLAAALGIGLLIDPEGVTSGIGDLIESTGKAAGHVGSSLLDSLLSSPIVWTIAGIALLFWLMSRDGDDDYDEADDEYYYRSDQPSIEYHTNIQSTPDTSEVIETGTDWEDYDDLLEAER
jgi:hypothetical protein